LEYKSLSEEKYFSDASKLVLGLGYVLVELRVFPMKEQVQGVVKKPLRFLQKKHPFYEQSGSRRPGGYYLPGS